MSRFYVKATSDTGKGTVTKGGNRELHVMVTINTPEGQASVMIECTALLFGKSRVEVYKNFTKSICK